MRVRDEGVPVTNWVYVLTGMYLMAIGLTAKSAPGVPRIDQEQDEARARAAPGKRIVVTLLGLLTLAYGVFRLAQLQAA